MSNQQVRSDVSEFLDSVEPEQRRIDGLRLLKIFQDVSGFEPRIWANTIIGFGRYHYKYKTGREGDYLATGFSPRKANLVIYIMPGYQDYDEILSRLGKHRMGKSCLYVNKLADVDEDVLRELIGRGMEDLKAIWPVFSE